MQQTELKSKLSADLSLVEAGENDLSLKSEFFESQTV